MMLFLTKHDISRLSTECRAELQRLIFEKAPDPVITTDGPFSFDALPEDYSFGTDLDYPVEETRDIKRVVDINPDEAKRLIANISKKSLLTLRLFTGGAPIALDTLIGTDRPYENLTDLKRSFVGAVTRRLRTVTRNKQAALFLQTSIQDDSDKKVAAITVRSASVEALRTALNIQEKEL